LGVWEPRHFCNKSHDDRSLFSHGNELTGDRNRLSLTRSFSWELGVSRQPKLPIRDHFALVEGYHVGYSSVYACSPKLITVVPRVALNLPARLV